MEESYNYNQLEFYQVIFQNFFEIIIMMIDYNVNSLKKIYLVFFHFSLYEKLFKKKV
jgi:hypothetical protein